MLVFDVPIEPIDGRYSEQWAEWFPDAFASIGCEVEQVIGDTVSAPSPGEFLNPVGTSRYKAEQLARLLRAIDESPARRIIVFVHDLWFPGIEALAYVRSMSKRSIGIYGYLHAGSYDSTDLVSKHGCTPWAQHFERAVLEMADGVFVGSHYHRNLLAARGDVSKVHVVGNPVAEIPYSEEKEPFIVWPHRMSADKNPAVLSLLKQRYPGQVVATKEKQLSKDDYYALLGKAKVAVSAAHHENFGIAMVEAGLAGASVVVPDRLAYPEVFEGTTAHLYRDESHMFECIDHALERSFPDDVSHRVLARRYGASAVTRRVVETIERIETFLS